MFQSGKYEQDGTDASALWAEGDWNCDGRFNSTDLVTALANRPPEISRTATAALNTADLRMSDARLEGDPHAERFAGSEDRASRGDRSTLADVAAARVGAAAVAVGLPR